MSKGDWLNTKTMLTKAKRNIKVMPCKKLGYCPYGQLVEEFPLPSRRTKYSCSTFGHNCPVFYHAESL